MPIGASIEADTLFVEETQGPEVSMPVDPSFFIEINKEIELIEKEISSLCRGSAGRIGRALGMKPKLSGTANQRLGELRERRKYLQDLKREVRDTALNPSEEQKADIVIWDLEYFPPHIQGNVKLQITRFREVLLNLAEVHHTKSSFLDAANRVAYGFARLIDWYCGNPGNNEEDEARRTAIAKFLLNEASKKSIESKEEN